MTDPLRFIATLFEPDDVIEARLLPSGKSFWELAKDADRIIATCHRLNLRHENIYLGMCPRKAKGRRGNDGVAHVRSLWSDFDERHLTATTVDDQVTEARQRIADAGLPDPTITNHSGHGVHTIWRLSSPLTDFNAFDETLDALITATASCGGVKGADRIFRCPGFTNWKPPVAPAVMVECVPSRRYALDDIACAVLHGNLPEPADVVSIEKAIAAKPPRVCGADRASVIDAFNSAVPVAEILKASGYDVVGHHFRRPGKEDRGFSGILRKNRAGSMVSAHWSSNDVLNDGKFKKSCGVHDAFDVFTILDHKGDVSAAVKAAARLLGMETKHKPDLAIMEEIMAGDDASEFSELYTAHPQTSDSRIGMKRIMAKYTTNPKQVDRIIALSAAAVGVAA